MIKFENTEVMGWEHAIRGMRNPLNSWDKSDSKWWPIGTPGTNAAAMNDKYLREKYCIGPNDLDLMKRLRNAGTDHRKFMRMITVYVDITAPMYWWSEYDTYKIGTVANSTSKMHKLLAKPFEMSDFSFDKLFGYKFEPKQFRPDVDEDLEIWKRIPYSVDGWYVSDYGRVKHNDKILSCIVHNDGYIFSVFRNRENNKYMQKPVHRIVAETFIQKIEGKDYINHKDGNKMNNHISNLEWCTQSENVQHSIANNLQPKGLSTYKGKFSKKERDKIKEMWDSGKQSRREIAKIYGVSHTCINDIINDKYKYTSKENVYENVARPLVDTLNELRDAYFRSVNEIEQKKIWYTILQLLPNSYNQKRTVMLNYEVLANIYKSRKNHKLDEWHDFCDWICGLPYGMLITGEFEE